MCGTDNKTYESPCHFFATKCALEGTKKGHKLHLDYIGPCKCERITVNDNKAQTFKQSLRVKFRPLTNSAMNACGIECFGVIDGL